MNILLTTETYFPYITGVSVSTDNIARFMLSCGHNVTLVCPKQLVRAEVDYPKGLKVVLAPSFPFTFYNKNTIAVPFVARRVLEKELKNTKFDIIHNQEPGIIGLTALSLAKKYTIPIVGSFHFIPEQTDSVLWGNFKLIFTPIIRSLIKSVYNKYDQIMTVSNFFAGYLTNIGVIKPITVVSNGVDINVYKPQKQDEKTRTHYGFKESDVLFFYLGRLDKDKNVETLVRAMPKTNKEIKLVVVGRGTETKVLQELARKLKVEDKIKYVDYVTDSEMLALYSAVDAFCIMSPYEGQSIVTLQAVAAGLPVIAANAGALPELVENNINGYLVKTYDYSSLASKMNALGNSKKLRQKFGLESRKISLKHERKTALRKLEKLYFRLIS